MGEGAPAAEGMRILTLNTGSSSLKAALYDTAPSLTRRRGASVERIGLPDARLRVEDAKGVPIADEGATVPDHDAALALLLRALGDRGDAGTVDAVGHRVVHGGARWYEPQRVTPELLRSLDELVAIDPDHAPQAIGAIRAIARAYPGIPQIACFDTAFHRAMPAVARMYPLPPDLANAGVVRYGFHGLSCEYIVQELHAIDARAADGRVIVAHLGNGASLTAVRAGRSVDTTMGFSPTGGVMMGTRSGDLDPGVLLHVLRARGGDADGLSRLVNRDAGLRGVSGISEDMRDLLAREAAEPRAAAAIALFCYQARKFVGALAAVLGGLDTLVFTGGIGEHAGPVRARICAGLEFLGIRLDDSANAAHAAVISTGATVVRVMKTDEDIMVARHVRDVMSRGSMHHVRV